MVAAVVRQAARVAIAEKVGDNSAADGQEEQQPGAQAVTLPWHFPDTTCGAITL
jgi:hypothetical protein